MGGGGGSMHPVLPKLRSLLAVRTSIQIGLHPRETDTGWDVADPAWYFNLYFSVLRPLLLGDAATAHESDNAVAQIRLAPARTIESLRWVGSCRFGEERLAA